MKALPVYDSYKMSYFELIKYLSLGLALGLLICWLCYHSIYALPIAFIVAAFYFKRKKNELREIRKKQLLYHFKDFVGALHTALNAGYSVENGIGETLSDMRQLYGEDDVMTLEVRHMLSGMRLGKEIEDLFFDLGRRSEIEDIRLFSELIAIGRRQGGRIGKILGDTVHIICGKIDTQQEIDKQLAAKKYEHKIMSLMPACVIVYLRLTFSGFIEQLYGNLTGVMIMTACLGVYAAAYCIGEKIVSIEI